MGEVRTAHDIHEDAYKTHRYRSRPRRLLGRL